MSSGGNPGQTEAERAKAAESNSERIVKGEDAGSATKGTHEIGSTPKDTPDIAGESLSKVTKVDYSKGAHFTKDGNRKILKPNIKYVDQFGYTYTTDDKGRISSVEGDLDLIPDGAADRRNQNAQRKIVRESGIRGHDDGGHYIGNQFRGSGDVDNLFPQHGVTNKSGGDWYKMEMVWKEALSPPKETVEVSMTPIYDDSKYPNRPSSVIVEYSIGGRRKVTNKIDNPRP